MPLRVIALVGISLAFDFHPSFLLFTPNDQDFLDLLSKWGCDIRPFPCRFAQDIFFGGLSSLATTSEKA